MTLPADPKGNDLDFTGQFAAYKPPGEAKPAPPHVEHAATQSAHGLAQEGFHVLITRKSTGGPRPHTVFLVDEDAAVVEQVRKTLAGVGIAVLHAPDARSTSKLLSKVPAPGMFLMNVGLPGGVDGFGLLQRIRKHPALATIPVVMFTTHDSRGEIVRGLMDGADGYLAKSAPPDTLVKVVRTILGH